ncbi:MAG: hypothetical protein AAGJ93_02830, partial [Bacteroidota bacterium]
NLNQTYTKMTVSQQINQIQDNSYDDDIIINGIPQGFFPAVIDNSITDGSTTREISVLIMPLEQSPGGTMSCNPGLFTKGSSETSIQVTVKDDSGKELASNTTDY